MEFVTALAGLPGGMRQPRGDGLERGCRGGGVEFSNCRRRRPVVHLLSGGRGSGLDRNGSALNLAECICSWLKIAETGGGGFYSSLTFCYL